MDRTKGVAYCGLACCLCSGNASCPGCRNGGCGEKAWCRSLTCCRERSFSGCWECPDFPCDNPMLAKPRVRTFAAFIRDRGEAELMDLLEKNEAAGLLYHYGGQLVGDYDKPATEEGILRLLLTGR